MDHRLDALMHVLIKEHVNWEGAWQLRKLRLREYATLSRRPQSQKMVVLRFKPSSTPFYVPRATVRKDLFVCSFLSSQFLLMLHSSLLFPFKEKGQWWWQMYSGLHWHQGHWLVILKEHMPMTIENIQFITQDFLCAHSLQIANWLLGVTSPATALVC